MDTGIGIDVVGFIVGAVSFEIPLAVVEGIVGDCPGGIAFGSVVIGGGRRVGFV